MKIKATLKKLKRGDVVSIDWIDAGDIEDSSSSWFSEADAEKVFKEIPVQTIAVYNSPKHKYLAKPPVRMYSSWMLFFCPQSVHKIRFDHATTRIQSI